MQRFETSFKIELTGFARTCADFYEPISISTLCAWNEACNVFSHIAFPSSDGFIEAWIEWTKARDIVRKFTELEKMSTKEALVELESWEEKYEHVTLVCRMSAPIDERPEETQRRILRGHLEMILHNFFLAMNLSSPGCCNLYSASFEVDRHSQPCTVSLDSGTIEGAWIASLRNGWPEIKNIPLANTWKWLGNVTTVGQRMSRSRTERALFALLHVCRQSYFNPNMLLWLTHMLEALYDTPVTLIHKFLRDRIFLVLGEPVGSKKTLTKRIREFYNLRSEFVHGGLDVVHPAAESDALDESVRQYENRLMEAIDFVLTIGLATLQRQILERWSEIEFVEKCYGKDVS